jgi:precorrin-2 dehydrogenase / sirohydrochlorin ferrochelatase
VLPIVLNPQTARIGLAGAGEGFAHRLATIRASGVEPTPVASVSDLKGLSVLFVAGLEDAVALATAARAAGILVNVEDRPELCDFNVPAIARRGALIFTVSTGGKAPGLARRLREWLEEHFGAEWEGRLAELGAVRERWRAEGVPAGDMSERTRAIIASKGWL